MKVIRLPAVEERTGLRRSTIYQKVQRGEFPPPVKLGQRASGWVEEEVENWLQKQLEQSRAG